MFCKNCGEKLAEEITICQNCGFNQDSDITKLWKMFNRWFWIIFFTKVVSTIFARAMEKDIVSSIGAVGNTEALIVIILQSIAILAMVLLMGYFGYKFTNKKTGWLYGIFGLFWFAIIAIFLGYFVIKRLKDEKLGLKKKAKSFRLG